MPIYEFYCPDNHKIYSFLARSLSQRDRVPRCPDNPSFRMEKRVSRFAFVKGVGETVGPDPFAGMDETKMESFMAEMEREMSGMDENNPDPRHMGRLMRKMSEAMGDKAPPEMREMIKRLEAGEDPEKLEDKFGDLEAAGEGGEGVDLLAAVKRIRAGLKAPVRDPKLYDLGDWIQAG